MLKLDQPALVLAPMEGIVDAPMRAFQSEIGAFSYAVAPFVRVSIEPVPEKVFLRDVPELTYGGKTPCGLPVQVQLLGGNPDLVAQSALTALSLGADSIDLNFGCPAKTVNRHGGGAILLKEPKVIAEIVRTVCSALPKDVPVSVKIRLGWDDPNAVFEIAGLAADAGAAWLTVHARTRTQGYAPPAQWEYIGQLRKLVDVPLVANGDIWTVDDLLRCRDATGCSAFMIGRGALADPLLSVKAAVVLGLPVSDRSAETDWHLLVSRFLHWNVQYGYESQKGTADHLKEWLRIASRRTGLPDFDSLRTCQTTDEILHALRLGA